MRNIAVRGVVLALLIPSVLALAGRPGQARAADALCFPQTGQCVDPIFLNYWSAYGLAQFGYPLSGMMNVALEDGKPYQVQYFERGRLEYHPDNASGYRVLAGLLGAHFAPPSASSGSTTRQVFAPFVTYFRQAFYAPPLGAPISDAFTETLEDGHAYTVQYFERARLEYHRENPAPYDVLVGQLGRRALTEVGH
jgi:polysaccharide biosynthesis protein PslG